MEDPLSEDILRGGFKGKDLIKITVKQPEGGDKHLYFESVKTEGKGGEKKMLAQAASDAT